MTGPDRPHCHRPSAVLADLIEADELFILTDVAAVAIHYKKPGERFLSRVTAGELEAYWREGHFPEGSMGPKVEAALNFLRKPGKRERRVLITSPECAGEAILGSKGTWIVRG